MAQDTRNTSRLKATGGFGLGSALSAIRTLAKTTALTTALALSLSGCVAIQSVPGPQPPMFVPHPGPLRVATSVAVWADLIKELGGNQVRVDAIVHSANQDPHSYQASVRDQLTVNRADLTIANGMGYDDFFAVLVHNRPKFWRYMDVTLWDMVEQRLPRRSALHFNPHLWFDPALLPVLIHELEYRLKLGIQDKASRRVLNHNRNRMLRQAQALQNSVRGLWSTTEGKSALLTESFGGLLLNDLHLSNATPLEFQNAVEQEQDASPSVMHLMQLQLQKHQVSVLITNRQTAGAQTAQLERWARAARVPVVSLSEVLPPGKTYFQWMNQNVEEIGAALK